ncbi:MAG: SprT-like domain-containing protein [Acidobacteriota bacterium]
MPLRSAGPSRAIWAGVACLTLITVGWLGWGRAGSGFAGASARTPTPAETLQRELLEHNLDKPGDPELDALYQATVARHFPGAMPPIPVLWEPRLAQVGLVAAETFTLEGMFGHEGKQTVILLNPDLQRDQRALARALCHEMVHAYLYVTGDKTTDHGPAFQLVLQRLSVEGAFEGIMATDQERAALRAWIDGESPRIEVARRDLDQLGSSVEAERVAIEGAIADVNARGPASATEAAALNARREAYNQLAIDANVRSARLQADRDHFNREVERYNLMLVYPAGIDQRAAVSPPATTSPGRTPGL